MWIGSVANAAMKNESSHIIWLHRVYQYSGFKECDGKTE